MIDPLGRVLIEIRDDAGVAALTDRIRGGEPAPGDAKGAGEYQRFVVLARISGRREKRLPVQEVRIAARCYAATAQAAAELAGAVSDAVHGAGPRISAGVGIWNSWDDSGGGLSKDPDTAQPYETVFITVNAATQVIA